MLCQDYVKGVTGFRRGVRTMDCAHDDHARTLFCALCGKVKDRDALKRVRLEPRFTGGASLNPNIERFWASGDPAGL